MDSIAIKEAQLSDLRRQVAELTVLDGELSTIRKSAKVYKQQPNSQIFFLCEKTLIKNEVKENLTDLKKKLKGIKK